MPEPHNSSKRGDIALPEQGDVAESFIRRQRGALLDRLVGVDTGNDSAPDPCDRQDPGASLALTAVAVPFCSLCALTAQDPLRTVGVSFAPRARGSPSVPRKGPANE